MAKSDLDGPIGDEVEALDAYTAFQQEASSAKRRVKAGSPTTSSTDDEEEEEETFGPSVEEEIDKQESHVHGQPTAQEAKDKEDEDELVQERRATDELALLDDLAGQIEEERYDVGDEPDEM
jgi:hypothetical protein